MIQMGILPVILGMFLCRITHNKLTQNCNYWILVYFINNVSEYITVDEAVISFSELHGHYAFSIHIQ